MSRKSTYPKCNGRSLVGGRNTTEEDDHTRDESTRWVERVLFQSAMCRSLVSGRTSTREDEYTRDESTKVPVLIEGQRV